MKKISLFFGAGAECSYGLPSGGKFALDIFRMATVKDKETFKVQLSSVDSTSRYAKWLPDDFMSKKLTAFTRGQYDSIVKGSLENKRHLILDYLKNFDNNVGYIIEKLESENIEIDKVLESMLGTSVGEITYGKEIKLNKLFEEDFNSLFASDYFSALLKLIEVKELSSNLKKVLQELLELF